MNVNRVFQLKRNSITSIAGAGGKTTLMFSLAEELRHKFKVLVTTTTKIYVPQSHEYDFIATDEKEFERYNSNRHKGIYVYGSNVNKDEKLIGLSCELLEKQRSYFDYILVEADGSKGKEIKGWNENEPVISRKTEKTIGVVSIEALGKEISEKNVHRVQEFMEITNSRKGELINIEHITALIFHNRGLFKNAVGEKVLFINKAEGEQKGILARELLNNIERKNNNYINKVVIGKLK